MECSVSWSTSSRSVGVRDNIHLMRVKSTPSSLYQEALSANNPGGEVLKRTLFSIMTDFSILFARALRS